MKKIVILIIAGLVLLGCIVAAGCTTNSVVSSGDSPGQDVSDKNIPADVWVSTEEKKNGNKIQTLYFYEDGTGIKKTVDTDGEANIRSFTWELAGPYYTLVFTDNDTDTFTLVNGKLLHDNHYYVKKKSELNLKATSEPEQDSKICGTWTYSGLDAIKTLVINEDGTGYKIKNIKMSSISPFTWKKTGSHYYTLFYEDGEDDTLVYSNETLDHDGEIYSKN